MRADNFVRLKLAVSRLIGAFPPGFRERKKAVRVRRLILSNGLFQAFPNSAGEIHHDANVFPLHQRKQIVYGCEVFHFLADSNAPSVFGL